jgi:hypothetical protein
MPESEFTLKPGGPEPISEMLGLLSQMTPAALAANRDELFFRAGEASARAERARTAGSRRDFGPAAFWPAAAAVLAMVAVGLGVALGTRAPEVRLVYVERPAATDRGKSDAVAQDERSTPDVRNSSEQPLSRHFAMNRNFPPGVAAGGMINPQDWAALSDAFAHQLRIQEERIAAARNAAIAAAEDTDEKRERDDARQNRPRTYLDCATRCGRCEFTSRITLRKPGNQEREIAHPRP